MQGKRTDYYPCAAGNGLRVSPKERLFIKSTDRGG